MSSSEVSYKWVIQVKDRGARVVATDWAGRSTEEFDTREWAVTPDLDGGKPVIQWIGSGQLAQHYRFERKAEVAA